MPKGVSITEHYGANLAELLADKINEVHPEFSGKAFISAVKKKCGPLGYTQRIELLADELRAHLPASYPKALAILMKILGPENLNETGMFTEYYWVMPLGKFVEKYGLEDFDLSMRALEAITKRNTSEYAIRPYIRAYPKQTLKEIKRWAQSDDFHLRRLASEGLRPKLPWSTKLDTFVEEPAPVFAILEMLKEDPIKFVQKSVANHLTDYLKVNYEPTADLIRRWRISEHPSTRWIVKHATRKIKVEAA